MPRGGRKARACESCHNNPKALGYGIEDGRYMQNYDKAKVVDLQTVAGDIIPERRRVQSQAVPGLDHDLSQIVSRDGSQLVSVGSHWPLTGPLPADMRAKMERTGLCMGCHQEMENAQIWSAVNTPGWVDNEAHQKVMHKLLLDYARERAQ